MIKASEREMRQNNEKEEEKRIRSNQNLRYIYKENPNQKKNELPEGIKKVIEQENEKTKKRKGKGMNDIESLMRNS